jgi:cytochrome P450
MAVVGDHASKGFVLGLVLIGVTLYGLGLVIHRLFFSPLSKIPGPWLTRISTIPEANALKENRRAQWITDLFAQNPDAIAIRTSPNSVSFNHPDAVKEIYGKAEVISLIWQSAKSSFLGHGKTTDGFGKSSWYDAFSTTGESLFSTRSKKRHAMKRRMVAHGFSAQSLQTFEPYVDEMLHKFMSRIDAFANSGEPFDIYFWFELFTMDVSTYTNGQKGNSIHVVATWSFTWIEFTCLLYPFLSKTFANPFAHCFKWASWLWVSISEHWMMGSLLDTPLLSSNHSVLRIIVVSCHLVNIMSGC